MKTRYKQFNPKRRIASSGHASQVALDALAQRVRYGGNPEHKRNPGDFGLTPPADNEFRLDLAWQATGDADPLLRDTSAWLAIRLGDACLTRNLDTWSRTVRDNILVSAYPLAMWLAASWWRLSFEPLPAPGTQPDIDWRMAHELGAANHGYVWPRVVFAADGQSINVWAHQADNPKQSANYLCNLDAPRAVLLADFQLGISRFIEDVIRRAEACGHRSTDLAVLWAAVREDMSDERARARRTLEAELGKTGDRPQFPFPRQAATTPSPDSTNTPAAP